MVLTTLAQAWLLASWVGSLIFRQPSSYFSAGIDGSVSISKPSGSSSVPIHCCKCQYIFLIAVVEKNSPCRSLETAPQWKNALNVQL